MKLLIVIVAAIILICVGFSATFGMAFDKWVGSIDNPVESLAWGETSVSTPIENNEEAVSVLSDIVHDYPFLAWAFIVFCLVCTLVGALRIADSSIGTSPSFPALPLGTDTSTL